MNDIALITLYCIVDDFILTITRKEQITAVDAA